MPWKLRSNILGRFSLRSTRASIRFAATSPRVDNFRIEIETPVELTAQHRAGVEKAVHHRMIQNRLLHPPQISTQVKQPDKVLRGAEDILFRPSGLAASQFAYPRLAPWAVFFRRFAA